MILPEAPRPTTNTEELSVLCRRIPLLLFFKVLLFINQGAAAPGAGQQFKKQAEFKDHFVHKSRWAIKNIPTALAAVNGFFFHIYAPSANMDDSKN